MLVQSVILHKSNKFALFLSFFFVMISLCVLVIAHDLWGQCDCVRKKKKMVLGTAGSVLSVVFTFTRPAGD